MVLLSFYPKEEMKHGTNPIDSKHMKWESIVLFGDLSLILVDITNPFIKKVKPLSKE
jgi:hypothetical protein